MDKLYILLFIGLVLLTGSTAITKLMANSNLSQNSENQILPTLAPLSPSPSLIPEATPTAILSTPTPSQSPTLRPRREIEDDDERGEVEGLSTVIAKTFTEKELAPFDGTDPNLPIFLGLNGQVYDVSAGRDYYKVGGPYHFLAGRDSSTELNLIGGSLIKKKYPVIGLLVK